jgi:hypothetical protein
MQALRQPETLLGARVAFWLTLALVAALAIVVSL